jgi:hypothetical protein
MSELKPCPFCGSKALTNIFLDYEDIENLLTNVIDDYEPEVTCENERCINGWWLSPKDWNARPIEDALNARIEELEHDLTNKEIEYTDLWDDALAFQARIAELEAALTNARELVGMPQPPEVQK